MSSRRLTLALRPLEVVAREVAAAEAETVVSVAKAAEIAVAAVAVVETAVVADVVVVPELPSLARKAAPMSREPSVADIASATRARLVRMLTPWTERTALARLAVAIAREATRKGGWGGDKATKEETKEATPAAEEESKEPVAAEPEPVEEEEEVGYTLDDYFADK